MTHPCTKRCTKCQETKPLTDFYIDRDHRDGIRRPRSMCKVCCSKQNQLNWLRPEYRARVRERHAAKTPEERKAHRERARQFHLRQKYGLSNEEWEAKKQMQDGDCGICGNREATHTDHCHDTGENRMLLCNQCNQMIGFGQDDPALLRAAADYVESYR